ncbi:hypothetical protein D9M68_303260 [compost metagenome]
MAEHHALLLVRLEELDAYSHHALHQFPKLERHLLCADIRGALAQALRLTVTAWKRYHKKTTLAELDVEVEMLRVLVRKAFAMNYINERRYEVWSRHVDEIGRMVGGWIKSQK